jgi:hypothetical protein
VGRGLVTEARHHLDKGPCIAALNFVSQSAKERFDIARISLGLVDWHGLLTAVRGRPRS